MNELLIAANKGTVVKDPYFKNTTLLLTGQQGNTSQQNNLFLDSGARFTATITGTTMDVSAVAAGTLRVGHSIFIAGVALAVTITAFGTGTGGAGTYTISASQTVSTSTTMTSGFAITRNPASGPNAPTQGTFSPFSQTGWGNYFNGTTAYLSIASNAVFGYGTNDFTIECFFYLNALPSSGALGYIFDQRTTNPQVAPVVYLGSSGSLSFYVNGAAPISGGTVVARQWNHLAVARSSGTTKMFLNGSQIGSNYSDSNNYITSPVVIASRFSAEDFISGYVSNFRIVKGRAVYTSDFSSSIPTSPLTRTTGGTNPPQGTECSLLTCQSNRFLDSNGPNTPASSPLTITVNGSPSVQAFSPFNPSASWSAATYGGSGYFDGTGDWLSAPSNAAFDFGSGDFTIEFWFYATTVSPTFQGFCGRRADAPSYGPFSMGLGGSSIRYSLSTSGSSWALNASGGTVVPNTWNHAAFVRSGTSCVAYLNGVSVITGTVSGSLASSSVAVAIGTFANDGLDAFNGYMSNFRIVKGTAVYSGTSTTTPNFTLPTAPLTATQSANTNGNPSAAITGSATSLLLNYTNGGIYDATSKNDLETVGNAQISTTQSKWGGSSMAFDGTGDYLGLRNSVLFDFGSGDFTVEAWLYIAGNSSLDASNRRYAAIFSVGTTSAYDFIFNLRGNSTTTGTGIEIYNLTNGVIGVNGTITQSVWNHIAVSKSGSSVYFWLNGTQLGTTQTGVTGSWGSSSNNAQVARGAVTGYTYELNGYLQDLRITRGYARYTANFTAPTAAFPTL